MPEQIKPKHGHNNVTKNSVAITNGETIAKEAGRDESLVTKLDEHKPEGKKKKKVQLIIPTQLFEYLAELYKGQSFTKAYKNAFAKLNPESKLSFDQLENLFELGLENDKDNRLLLSWAEFLLERQANPSLSDSLMTYIEYVVSQEGNLSKLPQTSVFQVWMDKCETSNKAAYLSNQIDQIKNGVDKQGKPKPLSDSRKNILKCIGAIWLFYKEHASSEKLINELSRDTFGLDGIAPASIEGRALGFTARMVSSTNRESFAFFINYLSRQQSSLSSQLRAAGEQIIHSENKLSKQAQRIDCLNADITHKNQQINQLEQRIAQLESSLELSQERADHQGIHQRDELKILRGKVVSFLELEALTELRSAQVANSRTPPKTRIVEIKLDDVLQQIEEQVKWLKQ